MNKEIKFVYFDVGGVAILDFSGTNKWNEMLSDLKVPEADRERFKNRCRDFTPKLHIGEMSVEEELEALSQEFSLDLPADYDFLEDFVRRFEPNPSLSDLILKLQPGYRIGLLTNMYPGMLDSIKVHGLLPDVTWDVEVDSVEVKLEKPQPEIYKLAEKMSGVSGSEILFVDNLEENLIAAEKFGWQTLLYDPAAAEESSQKLAEILDL